MYVPERSRGINIRDWKGHGALLPVTIINIQSDDCTRAVILVFVLTIQSNDRTRGSTACSRNYFTILRSFYGSNETNM